MEQGEYFDLVFLNVEMKDIDGIKLGKTIREKLKNEITNIVYIFASQKCLIDVFEIRPLNLLVKPIKKEKLLWCVSKTTELIGTQEKIFEFKSNKKTIRIPLKKIIYFASNARKVKIIMENESEEFYGKLSNIEKQLGKDFIRIHKSYFVNSNYVKVYTYEKLRLCNGQVLNITRNYRRLVRDTLIKEK